MEPSFDTLPFHLRRLLPLIADGKSNSEIASEFRLTRHTVEIYVSTILLRTGAQHRGILILRAQRWLGTGSALSGFRG